LGDRCRNGDFGGTQVRGGEQMSHIRRAGDTTARRAAEVGGGPGRRRAVQRSAAQCSAARTLSRSMGEMARRL